MDQKSIFANVNSYLSHLNEINMNVKKAYIFGSYAKGDYNDLSDIDLAIIFSKLDDRFDSRIYLMKLTRNFDLRIEPHPFEEADFNIYNPIANEILKTGIQIL